MTTQPTTQSAQPDAEHLSEAYKCDLIKDGQARMARSHVIETRGRFNHHAQAGWTDSQTLAEQLLDNGYMPDPNSANGYFSRRGCDGCDVCFGARINLDVFHLNTKHRRIIAKNSDLTITVHRGLDAMYANGGHNEYAWLNREYTLARFGTEDIDRNWDAYYAMLEVLWPGLTACHLDARDISGELVASNIFHLAQHSVYGTELFYDPARRSTEIGFSTVLQTLLEAQDAKRSRYYLGNWTRLPSAYSWKDQFPGLELQEGYTWVPHTRADLRTRRMGAAAYPPQRVI